MGLRSFLRRRRRSKSSSAPTSPNSPTAPNPFQSLAFSSPSNTQIEELKTVFGKFDANGDGKISQSELGSIMGSLGHPATEEDLKKMMEEVDSDGDGFIDLEEFIELNTQGVDSDKILEDLKNAFLIFDVDRSGTISPEELQKVMRSLGESCSMEECRKMIRGVDVDGDGMINFEEFKVMMMGGGGGSDQI